MNFQAETTHTLIERKLVVYRRERSSVWQCRYQINDEWRRETTGEHELAEAKLKAHELWVMARLRQQQGLPVITRRVKHIAIMAIKRMNDETTIGQGKSIYETYIRIINDYIIPCIGKREVTNLTPQVLDDFSKERIRIMGCVPTKSTMQKHVSALNRIFDEAVIQAYMKQEDRPNLEVKGEGSKVRPAFTLEEIRAVIGNFDAWIDRARCDESRERRLLLKDYVHFILDTGVRPGKEPLGVRWRQVVFSCVERQIPASSKAAAKAAGMEMFRSMQMQVTGKTGTRTIVAMDRSVESFRRIGERNFDVKGTYEAPFKALLKPNNDDLVFQRRTKREDGTYALIDPSCLENMFTAYLNEHNLLIDPQTGRKRVLYSLRHTYATFALVYDKVPIHTLARQMGTSVLMIERHYSHLDAVAAIAQLGGRKTQMAIASSHAIKDDYKSVREKKVA